jgi:hypothetical protein
MATTANQLDLSVLPPASRREMRDFYQFLLTRGKKAEKPNQRSYRTIVFPISAANCRGRAMP